jgi:hypothetical protein
MILGNRRGDACDHCVDIAFLKCTVDYRRLASHQVTDDARMLSREPVDDDGEESGG